MNSQNDEERHVLRYFRGVTGTFLDIGANDGVTLSNTYALSQRGWSGVLVEPSPKAMQRLTETYFHLVQLNRAHLYQVAIGPASGTATLQEGGEHLHRGDVGLLSTLFESEAKKWAADGNTFTQVDVRVITFAELLALSPIKTFDMVSLDAEGMDMVILGQMDLKALG